MSGYALVMLGMWATSKLTSIASSPDVSQALRDTDAVLKYDRFVTFYNSIMVSATVQVEAYPHFSHAIYLN